MTYQNWYHHLGAAADDDQVIVDLRCPPVPAIVIPEPDHDE